MDEPEAVLGIDLGTTTVKVVVVDAASGQVLELKARETAATYPSPAQSTFSEQDVPKIVAAVDECVADISPELKKRVRAVGVCGQMHGLVMWKRGERPSGVVSPVAKDLYSQLETLSCLYTWQDGRCSPEFLASMPSPRSHLRVATGFGCPTMMWLEQHEPNSLRVYDCAGTVQDFLVATLCDLPRPIMSVQNAASWGYFDTVSMLWNTEQLGATGFPIGLLPEVVEAGKVAGHLSNSWHGIEKGVPITAALGDLQCYMLSKLEQDSDAGLELTESEIWQKVGPFLNEQLLDSAAAEAAGNDADLVINPIILGERHDPTRRFAEIRHARPSNTSLRSIVRAVSRGVVANLREMSPRDLPGRLKRVVGCGGALERNAVMRQSVVELFRLPLDMVGDKYNADSAVGAAKAAVRFLLGKC